jgi:hypothetical protein
VVDAVAAVEEQSGGPIQDAGGSAWTRSGAEIAISAALNNMEQKLAR